MKAGASWLARHATALALIALTVLALALRLYRLTAQSLWTDEIFTALFSAPYKTLAEVSAAALSTPLPTPPLWFWLNHSFQELLGAHDAVVRLPSVLLGVLGVPAMFLTARTLFDRSSALIAAAMLALSPIHIFVSQEARYYAAIVFLSLLSLYFLHQGIHRPEKRWWVGFTIVTLLSTAVHKLRPSLSES